MSTVADKLAKKSSSKTSAKQVRLRLVYVDFWSAVKLSFLTAVALAIVTVVSVFLIFTVLAAVYGDIRLAPPAITMVLGTVFLAAYCAMIWIQFALGVWWYGEAMPTVRWVGFALVWVALVVFTVETVSHRRQLALATESSAA